MTGQRKKIYIEVIRVAAILLVLYCHTSVKGLVYFQMDKGNRSSELSIFVYPLAAGCVNLFFMISGALLLRKTESISTVLHKRFLRFFLVTAVAYSAPTCWSRSSGTACSSCWRNGCISYRSILPAGSGSACVYCAALSLPTS